MSCGVFVGIEENISFKHNDILPQMGNFGLNSIKS